MTTGFVLGVTKGGIGISIGGIVLGVAKGSIGENKLKANAATAFCAKMFRFKSTVFCFFTQNKSVHLAETRPHLKGDHKT